MANLITDPNAMDDGPVAVRVAYKAEAGYFRVNTPEQTVLDDIEDAVDEFVTEFPELKSRFYGKSTVRKLKRLGQVVDNIKFSAIVANNTLKTKMEAILGLV
jgi:hypothetical protein